MRIIRGSHRGRQIIAPKTLPVRPTTDYAKEGLFNILEHTFEFNELNVLDLFAGTGNISYEFASRGCKSITSVDSNAKCTGFIAETKVKLGFNNIRVIRKDAVKFLKENKHPFSLVFADPPYTFENLPEIPQLVLRSNVLMPGGCFILEHSGDHDFSENPFFINCRRYGEVHFSIFEFELPGQQLD
jgi:16S rRNA (guanine(966)-N(2))-methyltransferase RsmD